MIGISLENPGFIILLTLLLFEDYKIPGLVRSSDSENVQLIKDSRSPSFYPLVVQLPTH